MAIQNIEIVQVLQALQRPLFDLVCGDEVGHRWFSGQVWN
jgi:hypothetical protein